MSLVDLSGVPSCACNHGLDELHKALAEGPDTSIWRPHDNPWLTDLCEEFSRHGAERLLALQAALFLVLGLPADEAMLLRKVDLPEGDRPGIRARYQKPLGDYTPADWSDLVDLLVRTHLHPDDLGAQADWLSFRAYLAGRVHALSDQLPGWKPLQSLVALVTKPALSSPPPLPTRLHAAWAWARERIGMFLTNVSSSARFRIADVISSHLQEHGLSARPALQARLFDSFSVLNRDWRRIAITEAGEVANQAYLGDLAHGARVRRVEHYIGACPFCARLNGQEFIWSEQPLDESFGWTHVWPGKTNVGRSASPRKQTEDGLVERTEAELWWPAAGVQHPHCRGRWQEIPDPAVPPGVDSKFHAWVQSELATIRIPKLS